MKTKSGLDSIFFGGASGFEEEDTFGGPSFDDTVPGTGLKIGTLRAVARRQFIGSIVVALLVALAAVSSAMRPTQDGAPAWKSPMVQPSMFANSDRIAAIKRLDLP